MENEVNLASASKFTISDKIAVLSLPQHEIPSCSFDDGDDWGGDQSTYEEVSSIHNPTVGRSSRVVYLSTPAENKSDAWLKLFSELWKAYLRDLGLYQIDNIKLELVGSRQCGCDTINISAVTCVFKCGYVCPEFSVPLALMGLRYGYIPWPTIYPTPVYHEHSEAR
ncbi:hypothetical protein BDC45DRAFT_604402 [Circinella umbellata]|nr:hypothetical protein BDC45DRAFT_604402 [Circinella umbellata]